MKRVTKTLDLYKAAYLLLNGGELIKYRRVPIVNKHKIDRKGHKYLWVLKIAIEDETLLTQWDQQKAFVEANAYAEARKQLKKILYKEGHPKPEKENHKRYRPR